MPRIVLLASLQTQRRVNWSDSPQVVLVTLEDLRLVESKRDPVRSGTETSKPSEPASPLARVSQQIITQDPGSVTGTEEGEVTLRCTVTGARPGPVRWYRDTGSGRQYLYSTVSPPSERNDPRVSQVHQHDATDSSIRIVRLTLRDSGMYYCEKYGGIDVTFIARGSGSRLNVQALPPLIITQNPDSVTGTEEGQVTVPCTLSRVGAAGPVRWYRGTGSGRQYLYSTDPPPPNERNDPRVSRAYPMNPTDFSIRIVRLTVNDSGMYYCEKYRGIDETPIARGSGSRLSVRGVSQTIITQDPSSVTGTEEGEVTVPCTVTGGPGPVRWYRDTGSGRQYLYSPSPPPSSERNDPRVSQVHQNHPTDLSIRIVRLTLRDSGMYYCEKYGGIDETLIASGSGSSLSVRGEVKPDVSIEANPESVKVNESVSLTCRARGFYPERVSVSWVQQGSAVEPAAERGENVENEDGTFSRNSVLNVTVTQELSGATVSCRVQIEGLAEPVHKEHILVETDPKPDQARLLHKAVVSVLFKCWSELLLYLSAVLLGESVLLLLTHRSTAVRLDRMERGLLVSLVILVCSPSRGVSETIITQDRGSVTGTEEGECCSELLLYLSAVLLGESVLLLLTHWSIAVRPDRMERGLLVSLVILVCCPSRGSERLADLRSSILSLSLTGFQCVLFSVCAVVPVLPLQYLTFVLQVLNRSFLYGGNMAFLIIAFPPSHFGKLYGLLMSLSAVVSLLQYPCFILVKGPLQGDPLYGPEDHRVTRDYQVLARATNIYQHLPRSTKIYQHLPRSTKGYQDLPRDTKIYQHLPRATNIYQDLLRPTKIYQHLPRSTKGYQDLPTSTNIYQDLPTSTKGYQDLPTSTKIYQGIPRSTKGYQDLPTSSKGYQHLPRSTKAYQDLPTSTKGYQDLPRDTKIYQHLPRATNIYQHLPRSTNIYQDLPRSANIYQDLPTSTKGYQHLPTSTKIYQHLPRDTKIYQGIPRSTNIYQDLPTSANIYQPLPTSTKGYQGLPTSTNIYQGIPRSTNIYQDLPRDTKIYQHLPRSTNIYQGIPTSTNIYQDLPTSTKGYQALPTSTKGYQHLPRDTKIYQHLP
ncbi:UNVERIFIED_CONTAM: hypothetical protein FKN15_067784 [Acipenser sinensis]